MPLVVCLTSTASFYPALGPYSSKDPAAVADHMAQLRRAHVGVIAVSWYAPQRADPNVRGPPRRRQRPGALRDGLMRGGWVG